MKVRKQPRWIPGRQTLSRPEASAAGRERPAAEGAADGGEVPFDPVYDWFDLRRKPAPLPPAAAE